MFHEGTLFSKEWNARTSRVAFLQAVVVVYEKLAADDRQPASTYWSANHQYLRAHALPRIREEWAARTGLERELFPWSDDEVATSWEEWRKCNLPYRAGFCRQLDLLDIADRYARRTDEKRPKQEQLIS
jgi:hypothetical protein